MMFLILSTLLLLASYMLKILRQAQFIEIYERPQKEVLSKALSITFLLNLILPFRLGNIFRIIFVGKHLKNGKSFALATILIDLILDLFTITIVFCVLFGLNLVSLKTAAAFLIVSLLVLLAIAVCFIFAKIIKKIILFIANIFNPNLKLKLLKSTWFFILSFKDMFKKVNKRKLLLYTITSIGTFMLSFWSLAKFFHGINSNLDFVDIFYMMYGNLKQTMLQILYKQSTLSEMLYMVIYLLIPIILVFIISYLYKTRFAKKIDNHHYLELLPHVKSKDRLVFLEKYFSSKELKYIKHYLKLNQDIAIIEDYSAGSNATTMLCSQNGETFYRKYAFGKDASKLHDQVSWINNHADKLLLTEIKNAYYKDGVCCYDMPYVKDSVTCFSYVHTRPLESAWKNIKLALEDVDKNLHSLNRRPADKQNLNKYIDSKVIDNLN